MLAEATSFGDMKTPGTRLPRPQTRTQVLFPSRRLERESRDPRDYVTLKIRREKIIVDPVVKCIFQQMYETRDRNHGIQAHG